MLDIVKKTQKTIKWLAGASAKKNIQVKYYNSNKFNFFFFIEGFAEKHNFVILQINYYDQLSVKFVKKMQKL